MKKKMLCIVVVLLMALSLVGCTSQQDVDDAYNEGYEDGRRSGYDEGYYDAEQDIEDDPGAYDWYEEDMSRMLREADRYAVMMQQFEDLFYRLLDESGLPDIQWRLDVLNIKANEGDPIVYLDEEGRYYHTEFCPTITDTSDETYLFSARLEHIEPCQICEPVTGIYAP